MQIPYTFCKYTREPDPTVYQTIIFDCNSCLHCPPHPVDSPADFYESEHYETFMNAVEDFIKMIRRL